MKSDNDVYASPELKVHVLEPRADARSHWMPCRIGHNVEFSTDKLESYCVATWEPVIYDALLVGAAVEFADRTLKPSDLSHSSTARKFCCVGPKRAANSSGASHRWYCGDLASC